jgi:hypothetical protein
MKVQLKRIKFDYLYKTRRKLYKSTREIIVAYFLKARTLKPTKTAVAREWLCKHSR